jgi:hypothetical protein
MQSRAAPPAIAEGITSATGLLRFSGRRSGRREQSSTSSQDAAVGPFVFSKQYFAFTRLGIKPARHER